MPKTSPPLSAVLPPLVFGTATFNSQYNPDPYALPAREIVARALSLGIRAFDTSPYYGPSEKILGQALDTDFIHANFPRSDYFLLTKVGRIGSAEFDYSPAWVRQSVERSLARLRTDHLDLVYCHDVEFVSTEEVFEAVLELRRIRDQTGKVRYIGISGYPVAHLCSLAELVLERTGEPLDAVMSYANYTLQNRTLATQGLARLQAAGVEVVPNASILGMGLLRRDGLPIGGQGDWHPASLGLRAAVRTASKYLDAHDERLEKVAIRSSVEDWMREGAVVGSKANPASGILGQRDSDANLGGIRLGVSVMGVSSVEELNETMRVWRSILDTLEHDQIPLEKAPRCEIDDDRAWGLRRRHAVQKLVEEVRTVLGEWVDVAWDSPPPGFINQRTQHQNENGTISPASDDKQLNTPPSLPDADGGDEEYSSKNGLPSSGTLPVLMHSKITEHQLLTPGASPPRRPND